MIKQATQGPYWWPTMTRDIQSFIKQYSKYKQKNDTTLRSDSTKMDWRKPIMKYLNHEKTKNRDLFEQEYETYFMEEEELQKEVNPRESKICIAGDQIKHLIKRVHKQKGCYLNPNNIIQQILNGPYWWPTIVQDMNDYINAECPKCKKKTTTKIQYGAITTDPQEDWKIPFIDYLSHGRLTTSATVS